MEVVYHFTTASSLRHDRFVDSQKKSMVKVMESPKLSDTRWLCRYAAVKLFKEHYRSLLQALVTHMMTVNGLKQLAFLNSSKVSPFFYSCVYS